MAITRSGGTSEALTALASVDPGTRRSAITGVGDGAVQRSVGNPLVLDFADEQSVVQTRFITAVLILTRHAHGYDMRGLPDSVAAAPL
ncbi:MAG: sugar isomerase, partial [Microbacteriaceae bacterium]|nr:sugar isomerase [Microbacteriaceae bacterium]